WPDFGRSRPMMLLSSVVLPTPLRPMRQTTFPCFTSRSTSRRMSVSPYATCSCLMLSIGLPVVSEIYLNHLGIALHFLHGALTERLALVQNGHSAGDLADESHVVVDHHQRMLAGQRQEQLTGAFGLLRR